MKEQTASTSISLYTIVFIIFLILKHITINEEIHRKK